MRRKPAGNPMPFLAHRQHKCTSAVECIQQYRQRHPVSFVALNAKPMLVISSADPHHTLMTIQMSYQDPLNPLRKDMAMFSTGCQLRCSSYGEHGHDPPRRRLRPRP